MVFVVVLFIHNRSDGYMVLPLKATTKRDQSIEGRDFDPLPFPRAHNQIKQSECIHPTNELPLTNQSINQSTNQPTNQPINQSINQSIKP
jgi:hypothetical protein